MRANPLEEITMATEHDERVRERAYHLWRESGGEHGKEMEHWLQAEREQSGRTAKAKAPAKKAAEPAKAKAAPTPAKVAEPKAAGKSGNGVKTQATKAAAAKPAAAKVLPPKAAAKSAKPRQAGRPA